MGCVWLYKGYVSFDVHLRQCCSITIIQGPHFPEALAVSTEVDFKFRSLVDSCVTKVKIYMNCSPFTFTLRGSAHGPEHTVPRRNRAWSLLTRTLADQNLPSVQTLGTEGSRPRLCAALRIAVTLILWRR